jgi:hypothetical protein
VDVTVPDFEVTELAVLPRDDAMVGQFVKPGHWHSARQVLQARNDALPSGRLQTAFVDRHGLPLSSAGSWTLLSTRPVSLPRNTPKRVDLLFFTPLLQARGQVGFVQTTLHPRDGRRRLAAPATEPTLRLQPYQYHLVVLASQPDRYGFLKSLPSVQPRRASWSASGLDGDYVVVLPKSHGGVDVPAHPLAWTSIAYVVWDELDPQLLTADQYAALLDWLHWGGQLIVSGPRSLDLLAASPLAPYLPAREDPAGSSPAWDRELLRDLRGSPGAAPDASAAPPEMIPLVPTGTAQYVPRSSRLAIEHRVGRGRLVITAFPLSHPTVVRWPGFDSFFHASLLRRPPRSITTTRGGQVLEAWQAGISRDDPRLTCRLRYFCRDARAVADTDQAGGLSSAADRSTADSAWLEDLAPNARRLWKSLDILGFRGGEAGVAGWNDHSDAAATARRILTAAAGISVPSKNFVAWALGVYLLVLVPVNWVLFRLLGRVEWAWLAVPVISVAGTLAVVRGAQLNVGFARSRTELAVLETQPGYSRGHLTRYLGLYASLSTTYQLRFDEPTALAQPLLSDGQAGRSPFSRQPTEVTLHRDAAASLSGFRVQSSTTGMVHTEQMIDLEGNWHLRGTAEAPLVANDTDEDLHGAALIRRDAEGEVQVAWVGHLPAGRSQAVRFQWLRENRVDFPEWSASRQAAAMPAGQLSLGPLLTLAADPQRLGPGQGVLVGWTDRPMPGLAIRPAASQQIVRTVIVAHLRYAPWPAPQPDAQAFRQVGSSGPGAGT